MLGVLTFQLMAGAKDFFWHKDLGWGLGGGGRFFEKNGGPFWVVREVPRNLGGVFN